MHKRQHIVIILFVTLVFGGVAACKKWVDVDTPLQLNENTVFANEQGFRNVLDGVYLKMGDSSLYGRDLMYGLLSILGRSYDTEISTNIKNVYYQAARYNFGDADVKKYFASVWKEMYQGISNVNYVLANLESRKNVLTGSGHNALKGEALGLRAFLYFDLVRMFAAAPVVNPNSEAVPYVTQVSPYETPVATASTVIESCINDLLTAQTLLSASDKTTSRMTIWGIKGLLARIYLYKGDLVNARAYATELINSQQFPLYTINTTSSNDYLFQKEHLFSLYGFQPNIQRYLKTVFTTTPPLGLSTVNQTALFVTGAGGGTGDIRKTFNDPVTAGTTGTLISPRKFTATQGYSAYNVLPMIRMTEMYYIAAECATTFKDSLTATNLLDSVRAKRGLQNFNYVSTTNTGAGTTLNTDSLYKEIAREYQKEFLSEGQVFYYYKRKNLAFSNLPFTKVPPVANASYVFIKPE